MIFFLFTLIYIISIIKYNDLYKINYYKFRQIKIIIINYIIRFIRLIKEKKDIYIISLFSSYFILSEIPFFYLNFI